VFDLEAVGSADAVDFGREIDDFPVSSRRAGKWAKGGGAGADQGAGSTTSTNAIRLRRTVSATRPCFSASASLPKIE